MEELFLRLIFNWKFNIIIIGFCIASYIFNRLILRIKKEYLGMDAQTVLISLIPIFNIIFLFFNLTLMCMHAGDYKLIKKRKQVKASYR